uniref:transcription elongation factor SPT5-like isoform X3 n=1 Tax=Myxine glutinosa TaxID=7769 RepID=UPI00358F19F6
MSDSEGSNFSDNDQESFHGSEAEEAEEAEEDEVLSAKGSDKEEEEEEDEGEDLVEEDEYDDEDEEEAHRAKKSRHSGFILDEADVDEDEYDDEQSDDDNEDIIDKEEPGTHIDDVPVEDHSGARRLQNLWREQREEELGEYYMKKYANSSSGEHYGHGYDELSDDITQQQLLPGVKDPNLWTVKCKLGEERATAIYLMRKFIAYQFSDTPLKIKSVVSPEHVKGYIYVESFKQTFVKQAIEGVGNLRIGYWNQQMVPIKEMTDVMKVVKQVAHLKPKSWVRLKRGVFKDDIAQVDFVEPSQNTIGLKLIPRIDYERIKSRMSMKDWFAKRKRFKRAPQRLFDVDKIRSCGGEVTAEGDFLVFEGNRYSRKGFIFKNFAMSAIISEGVKPTLSELEKFEDQPDGINLELITDVKGKGEKDHSFQPGDNVEVCEGELINLQGKVLSVDGNKITIMPKHEDLKDPLEFPAHELKKYFRIGDHVKVIDGRYEGDTGLIVRAEENFVILFSDLTMHELKVLPRDLQLCSETASGVDSQGQHEWGELVLLDPQTVGVIVRLERETFQVLSMHGKVLSVKHQAVTRKRDNRHAVALDSEQNNIQARDVVKVTDGPHSGREGEVKHLFRGFAFLHSKKLVENGGMFVCKTRHVVLAGGSKPRDVTNFTLGSFAPMSPRLSSPAHSGGQDPGAVCAQDRGTRHRAGVEAGGTQSLSGRQCASVKAHTKVISAWSKMRLSLRLVWSFTPHARLYLWIAVGSPQWMPEEDQACHQLMAAHQCMDLKHHCMVQVRGHLCTAPKLPFMKEAGPLIMVLRRPSMTAAAHPAKVEPGIRATQTLQTAQTMNLNMVLMNPYHHHKRMDPNPPLKPQAMQMCHHHKPTHHTTRRPLGHLQCTIQTSTRHIQPPPLRVPTTRHRAPRTFTLHPAQSAITIQTLLPVFTPHLPR